MCRARGNKKDTTLVDGGASISPEELGSEFLDYILRDGWIDIAVQCRHGVNGIDGQFQFQFRNWNWNWNCFFPMTMLP